MDVTLLVVRLILAATFATAGIAKLADRAGSRQAMIGFGLPDRLAGPAGTLLPVAELGAAGVLVPATTAQVGGAAALALLTAFVVAIAVNLARGRQPDCHCFGQLHSSPAGWPTLLRNAILAAGAGLVVVAGPGPTVAAQVRSLDINEPVAWALAGALLVVVVVLTRFGLALLRQNGRLLLRLEAIEAELAAGAAGGRPTPTRRAAPDFELPGVHGETLTLASLLAPGRPLLLLFTDPGCGPCNALMPDVGRWQHLDAFSTAIISRGDIETNRAKAIEHGVSPMLLQAEREVALSYGAAVTPCAVVVDADGFLASEVARGPVEIRALAATLSPTPRAAGSPPAQRGLAIGTPAPPIRLEDLDGRTTELGGSERPTMVLFWDPSCGFCQQMLGDLRAWEEDPPPAAPALMVVSTGDVEANRAQGLRAPVLLSPDGDVMASFGATGTPMAVIVDTAGRVASPLAAGRGEVMSLAAGTPVPAPPAS